MKNIIFYILLFSFCTHYGQKKYFTNHGEIRFENPTTSSFDSIGVINNNVSSILKIDTGEIAIVALVEDFKIESPLIESVYLENYTKSDQFTKAKLKGKIVNFNWYSYKKHQVNSIQIKGRLTINGIHKRVQLPATIEKTDSGKIELYTNLKLRLFDFNISPPIEIQNKISEEVEIDLKLILSP